MSTTDDDSDPATAVLDVRKHEGPPFPLIEEALADLPPGGSLTLVNSFEPEPLYDVLDERGFAYRTERADEAEWRVYIEHA